METQTQESGAATLTSPPARKEKNDRSAGCRRNDRGPKHVRSIPIEIRLKELLQRHGLDTRGITQQMADELHLHRHTIGKIYRNQLSNPSLVVLADICGWLHRRLPHVSLQQLLTELLVIRPPGLWEAVAAPGELSIWLGNHVQTEPGVPMWAWIAQEDAQTMKDLVALLSDPSRCGRQPTVNIDTVPFRYVHGQPEAVKLLCKEDKETVQTTFRELMDSLKRRSHILIGSQRVNYLLECFVAALFGCRPFAPSDGDPPRVPFHHVYRPADHPVPSCFGGRTLPGRTEAHPGFYYLDESGVWKGVPWERDRQDAAIVIVSRDPRGGGVLLAVFGFSGRATMSIGRHITGDSRDFWHPEVMTGGKHLGIYYCQLHFRSQRAGGIDPGQLSVVPLAQQVLKSYLKG